MFIEKMSIIVVKDTFLEYYIRDSLISRLWKKVYWISFVFSHLILQCKIAIFRVNSFHCKAVNFQEMLLPPNVITQS